MKAEEWLQWQIANRPGFGRNLPDQPNGPVYIHVRQVAWAMERYAIGDQPDTTVGIDEKAGEAK